MPPRVAQASDPEICVLVGVVVVVSVVVTVVVNVVVAVDVALVVVVGVVDPDVVAELVAVDVAVVVGVGSMQPTKLPSTYAPTMLFKMVLRSVQLEPNLASTRPVMVHPSASLPPCGKYSTMVLMRLTVAVQVSKSVLYIEPSASSHDSVLSALPPSHAAAMATSNASCWSHGDDTNFVVAKSSSSPMHSNLPCSGVTVCDVVSVVVVVGVVDVVGEVVTVVVVVGVLVNVAVPVEVAELEADVVCELVGVMLVVSVGVVVPVVVVGVVVVSVLVALVEGELVPVVLGVDVGDVDRDDVAVVV